MLENAPTLVRSLTTFGIRNAELLIAEIRTYRGNDTDVTQAHADDGTVVRLYGRLAPVESIQDTDTFMFPGTRTDVFTYMISARLWETPGTYMFLCGNGEKVRVTFV